MKIIELFAGIGSQAMALRNIGADYEIVGISEIDKFAFASYNGNRQPKVVTEFPENFSKNKYNIKISPVIKTKDGQCLSDLIETGYIIRKLTPLECWRVMDFSDEDFEKAKAVGTSDTQLYKQAGNSIVVDVLEGIFKNIIKANKENKKTGA